VAPYERLNLTLSRIGSDTLQVPSVAIARKENCPMPLDEDADHEFVEVKVSRKMDIELSLDDLLNAVQQQSGAINPTAQQVQP
jgi:hypothetical protein